MNILENSDLLIHQENKLTYLLQFISCLLSSSMLLKCFSLIKIPPLRKITSSLVVFFFRLEMFCIVT